MRVEIQMKRGHLHWPKNGSEDINLQQIYDDYWASEGHKLSLQSES